MNEHDKISLAAAHVRAAWGSVLSASQPPVAVLALGTGLGDFIHAFPALASMPYADIPGCPRSTVESHAGQLSLRLIADRPVLVLEGRFHLYEGYEARDTVFGVRLAHLLGANIFLATNAAGGLNPQFTGGLMAITDHINLTGCNPLRGANENAFGPRFPDMSRVYAPRLLELAEAGALKTGIRLERGVYAGVLGPSLETPAETRMLKGLGADAVGMSTVMEVIAARHMGMKVGGISCLTNTNLPDCMAEVSLEEILARARLLSEQLGLLIPEIIAGV